MIRSMTAAIVVLALAGSIAGCKKDAPGAEPAASGSAAAAPSAPVEATLGSALGKTAQFSSLAAAAKDTGLDGVLGGKASYTVFAPTNAAFEALGEKGVALRQPEQRAALAALLREHIVPGLLTISDLDKALARSNGKPLKLRSMGKGTLTVAREGGAVVVTGTDGAKGRVTAESAVAKNGAAIGVDGLLKKLT